MCGRKNDAPPIRGTSGHHPSLSRVHNSTFRPPQKYAFWQRALELENAQLVGPKTERLSDLGSKNRSVVVGLQEKKIQFHVFLKLILRASK